MNILGSCDGDQHWKSHSGVQKTDSLTCCWGWEEEKTKRQSLHLVKGALAGESVPFWLEAEQWSLSCSGGLGRAGSWDRLERRRDGPPKGWTLFHLFYHIFLWKLHLREGMFKRRPSMSGTWYWLWKPYPWLPTQQHSSLPIWSQEEPRKPAGAATQYWTILPLPSELELNWDVPRRHYFLVLPKDRTLLLPIRGGNSPRKGLY